MVSLQFPLYNRGSLAVDTPIPVRAQPPPSTRETSSVPALPHALRRALPLLSGHLVVALVALVVIGGTTRVMEAGLACPDWPLCYGALLPGRQMNLQVFLEWFHRLDAFLVGLALLTLSGISLGYRARLPRWLPWFAGGALALVAAQGLLGALTVLHLLEASTVTAHLVTALVLVLAVSALHQRLLIALAEPVPGSRALDLPAAGTPLWWRLLLPVPVVLVLGQCVLGGAMASQWSAQLCFEAGEACSWLLAHRLGAYPAAFSVLLIGLGSLALSKPVAIGRGLALAGSGLVLLQVVLGITTLRLELAVPAITVTHQFVAALLVAVLGALLGRTWPGLTRSAQPNLEVDHG